MTKAIHLMALLSFVVPADLFSSPLKTFELGNTSEIRALAFSHDAKTLAVSAWTPTTNGYLDTQIVVWSLDSGKRLHLRQKPWNEDAERNNGMYVVRGLEFSPDGQWLIASDGHGFVLWDTKGTERRRWASGISDAGLSPGWSPDSKWLALPSMEQGKFSNTNGIALLEVPGGSQLLFFPVEIGYAMTARISPGGTFLATAGHDCTVRVFDIQGRTNIFTDSLQGILFALAFHPDGKSFVTGPGSAGVMLRYTLARGPEGPKVRKVGLTPESREEIHRIEFTPGGDLAFTSSQAGLRFWNTSSWHGTPSLRNCFGRMSPDGELVALAKENLPGLVELWKTADLIPAQ